MKQFSIIVGQEVGFNAYMALKQSLAQVLKEATTKGINVVMADESQNKDFAPTDAQFFEDPAHLLEWAEKKMFVATDAQTSAEDGIVAMRGAIFALIDCMKAINK